MPPTVAQQLGDPALRETSGLTHSRLASDRLWLLNDGGHAAKLYALDSRGSALATLKLRGQRNRDWEDLASFDWRGRHWLLVADIGDNQAKHKSAQLHFIEEPELPASFKKLKRKPALSVRFRYPDGALDAEAIAFDPLSEDVLILSKRERPAHLYALSLAQLFDQPDDDHTARDLGPLDWAGELPNLLNLLRDPKRAVSHGMATAMDISDDGLQAVVLGYQRAVLLRRSAEQSWAEANRHSMPAHFLEQAEAVAFSRDQRSIVITSEGQHAPLLRQALP